MKGRRVDTWNMTLLPQNSVKYEEPSVAVMPPRNPWNSFKLTFCAIRSRNCVNAGLPSSTGIEKKKKKKKERNKRKRNKEKKIKKRVS